jgi:dipeptidyl aminopeptidase/acylaminoacyl peptidase
MAMRLAAKTAMAVGLLAVVSSMAAAPAQAEPTPLEAVLAYPFVSGLVSSADGSQIAWVETVRGVRNLWAAAAPGFAPHHVTAYADDDGQELTQLAITPDGKAIVYVRGGDHDANWPAEGNLAPDPAASPNEPKVAIWAVPFAGGAPRLIAEGDAPAVSKQGRVAFVRDGQVWLAALAGPPAPQRLAFDRGRADKPAWSPDGTRLAFASRRGDHGFIAVWSGKDHPLIYLAPSTGRDDDFTWSPDGMRIAFSRQPGAGGAAQPMLAAVPEPYALWIADAKTGEGHRIWSSPVTIAGSISSRGDGLKLQWMAQDTLAFIATLDDWEHLYAVSADGSAAPRLLTPGKFMVEHVAADSMRRCLTYAANTGTGTGDDDRRHVFSVCLDGTPARALTSGEGNEWSPVAAGNGLAIIVANAKAPPRVATLGNFAGLGVVPKVLHDPVSDYPSAGFVTPQQVTFATTGGFTIHGQLFAPSTPGRHPAVIFVHGGPSRQMLLGWHYRDYYSNAYAVNQALTARGFVVLSVNYRLGIGYGHAFEDPPAAGPRGGSEYQDVVAAGRWLQTQDAVDPARIGIWGGSYGGYLTAMALAHDSAMFKAGVDLHGVHDWSRLLAEEGRPAERFEMGEWAALMKTAFTASPVAAMAGWTSPVLLIQGDDDRNVRFNQTVDLAGRLTDRGAPFEELVLPNEIHGFLRHETWLKADAATVRFLIDKLKP